MGLTTYVTYLALIRIFGYGLPYTMCTRTPFRNNMLFVGVPPRDIFERLVSRVNGKTAVDRKREALERVLSDENLLDHELQQRIDASEFDLGALQKEWGLPANACRERLRATLRNWLGNWRNRMQVRSGIEAIPDLHRVLIFRTVLTRVPSSNSRP